MPGPRGSGTVEGSPEEWWWRQARGIVDARVNLTFDWEECKPLQVSQA